MEKAKGGYGMSITIELSPADAEFLRAQAAARNISAEEFSREAVMKAARNAAYLASIDRAVENADAGHCTYLTDEELKGIVYGS